MHRSFHLRAAGLTLLLAAVAGCSSQKTAIYEHENFDDSGTFSRNYPVSDTASCEAARRALLSQGYIITSSDPKLVSGHKSFQQTGETHMEISFSVVCAQDGSTNHRSTVFANALQDRYALKKVNNSASLGWACWVRCRCRSARPTTRWSRSPARRFPRRSSTSVISPWWSCSCRRKRKRPRISSRSRRPIWACPNPSPRSLPQHQPRRP
ncbi:putative lipoprotein [Pseudomonas chlororaphis subsp. aureofaciens]|nr:putative lipoprotein [Pseudomonas chlororaphis subsp. aureofaciens]